MIGLDEFEQRARFAGLNITLSIGQWKLLTAFLQLRSEWHGTHNLMGPMASEKGSDSDLLDAIAVSLVGPTKTPLVDVGAGGGVPGFMVSILQPEREVFLVEPRAKRAAFLRSAASRLQRKSVSVIRGRWPVDCQLLFESRTELEVVSRAVVSPEEWPSLATAPGAPVNSVIRMLAANRPSWQITGYKCTKTIEYFSAQGARRCVERWARIGD